MAPEKGEEMRKLIREYAEDVVKEEWESLRATGNASQKARKDIGDIVRFFGTLTPATKVREIVAAQFLQTFSRWCSTATNACCRRPNRSPGSCGSPPPAAASSPSA